MSTTVSIATAISEKPNNQPRLVVVGNGMAAMRCVEELLALAPDKYNITVVGKEPLGNYNRIMLSPVLAGEKMLNDIMLHTPTWYLQHGIRLCAGVMVIGVNRQKRLVQLDNGEALAYDRLLLATGSNPFMMPLENYQHSHVLAFRNAHDVQTMLTIGKTCQQVIVIGGGLLGLEAADGLKKQGLSITVVHNAGHLLNRQLDVEAATLLQQYLESQGITFALNAISDKIVIDDDGQLLGLQLKDGTLLKGQMIVMAVGVRPNITLAKAIGLQVDKAIIVNDTLQTSDPRIYAVGECVQHRHRLFGLVAPLYAQAKVAANHLAEVGIFRYSQKATATTLKVTGVNLYSAGDFSGTDSQSLVYRDTANAVYKKLFIKNNQLVGAVLYGDIRDGVAYFELIQQQTDISTQRSQLMFGVMLQDELQTITPIKSATKTDMTPVSTGASI